MHNYLKKFLKDQSGAIAPIFATAILPIMFISGAAIDYTAQSRNIAYVSNMADSALLSVSEDVKELVKTITVETQVETENNNKNKNKNKNVDENENENVDENEKENELKTKVKALLDPILTASLSERKDMSYKIDRVTFDETTSELSVEIDVTQDTAFMQLAQVDSLKSTVTTAITFGGEKIKGALSIAFVVDKSGSMDDDWKHLKNSMKSLKNKFADLDPDEKFIRAGHVLYDSNSYGFFGMDWGMVKTWKEFKKAKYVPKAGQKTNSAGAIAEAYDKLKTNAENTAHAKKNSSYLRKVVVFFSDGDNDRDADTTSTTTTCTNMKADGIEIYTIMFGYVDRPKATAMMKNCASDTAHYFRANSKTKLQLAFDDIGESTTGPLLYLSH